MSQLAAGTIFTSATLYIGYRWIQLRHKASTQLFKSSCMGFGCMGMTAFYGDAMRNEDGVALLKEALQQGYSHFDTAEVYQQFKGVLPGTLQYNEALFGLFAASVPRASYTVATKYFPGLHDGKVDFESVSSAVDASLARLGIESIDLYYCHRMPATVEQLEEWMLAMKRVVESGRVHHVGLSEAPAAWIRRAHSIHPVAAIQQEWSLLTREPVESEVVPVCRELGITLVAYSPLARNLLVAPGKAPPQDWRADQPRYKAANFEKNLALAARIEALAKAKDVHPSALSLAWLMRKAAQLRVKCVPIPGTTKAAHATANFEAQALELSASEMRALEQLGATVAGERGNESYKSMAIEGKM